MSRLFIYFLLYDSENDLYPTLLLELIKKKTMLTETPDESKIGHGSLKEQPHCRNPTLV